MSFHQYLETTDSTLCYVCRFWIDSETIGDIDTTQGVAVDDISGAAFQDFQEQFHAVLHIW